jgi:hypothetical protein
MAEQGKKERVDDAPNDDGRRLYSRTEFARMANITKQAISKACRNQLAPACDGKRINAAHPAAVEYLARHGTSARTPLDGIARRSDRAEPDPPIGPGRAAAPPPDPVHSAQHPDETGQPLPPRRDPSKAVRLVSREVRDVNEVADMTIREVVAKFGTVTAFRDWLMSLKKIEDVREKNLRNAEINGKLISIELVRTHVMGAIESMNRRLLADTPKTLARRLYAAAKSDVPIEEAERMTREIISSQLRPMADTAARVLRDGGGAADNKLPI